MATEGYVDVVSTIENKVGNGRISIEAPPLTTGTPETYLLKRYPVAVIKPIYVPATMDSTSCISENSTKRIIEWINGISVELKARQPYDVWSTGVVRHNVNDETYDSLMVFAAFENISYADLVDMAAAFKRWEPYNLIFDDGRYPALDAFVPTPKLLSEVFNYAKKIQAAKSKNPDLKSWKLDEETPRQVRQAAPEPVQTSAATSAAAATTRSTDDGDIESFFS
jgi:hypothetical protein